MGRGSQRRLNMAGSNLCLNISFSRSAFVYCSESCQGLISLRRIRQVVGTSMIKHVTQLADLNRLSSWKRIKKALAHMPNGPAWTLS